MGTNAHEHNLLFFERQKECNKLYIRKFILSPQPNTIQSYLSSSLPDISSSLSTATWSMTDAFYPEKKTTVTTLHLMPHGIYIIIAAAGIDPAYR